jgi:hypothetical protein
MEYSFRIFIKKSDAIIKTKKVFDEKAIIAWWKYDLYDDILEKSLHIFFIFKAPVILGA